MTSGAKVQVTYLAWEIYRMLLVSCVHNSNEYVIVGISTDSRDAIAVYRRVVVTSYETSARWNHSEDGVKDVSHSSV